MQYHHGVRVLEINEGTRPIRTIETAVVGLVATGKDADESVFPLNEPVLVTDVYDALGSAGEQGTLATSLDAIASQSRPLTVIVRVAEGVDDAETTSNVIGTTVNGRHTGMKALLAAESGRPRVKPRIIGIPGLENEATVAALGGIAQQLRGFAYASDIESESIEDAAAFRELFGQRELMTIWPSFRAWNTRTNSEESLIASASALGLRAKIDNEVGWHKTLSNYVVNNVIGIDKDVHWDLQDPATDAGYLNSRDITTLINHNGFRFWGNRTCAGPDSLFPFENYTRTAQVLADTIANAHMWAVDAPMHPSLVKDIIAGINAKFSELKSNGYIIDAECWYDDKINTKETLKSGRLYIDYDYTPVPPLEDLIFKQRITDRHLINFAAAVNAA